MLRVISKTAHSAQVTISDPPVTPSMTLHLQLQGSGWRDRFGTLYDLDGEEVDWFPFYRDRLLTALKVGNRSPEDLARLASRMAHYIDKGDEPVERIAPYDIVDEANQERVA